MLGGLAERKVWELQTRDIAAAERKARDERKRWCVAMAMHRGVIDFHASGPNDAGGNQAGDECRGHDDVDGEQQDGERHASFSARRMPNRPMATSHIEPAMRSADVFRIVPSFCRSFWLGSWHQV